LPGALQLRWPAGRQLQGAVADEQNVDMASSSACGNSQSNDVHTHTLDSQFTPSTAINHVPPWGGREYINIIIDSCSIHIIHTIATCDWVIFGHWDQFTGRWKCCRAMQAQQGTINGISEWKWQTTLQGQSKMKHNWCMPHISNKRTKCAFHT